MEKKDMIAKLERMVGKKEVEIALLKNFLGEKVRLAEQQHRDERGLNRCLRAIGLPRSTSVDVSSSAYRQKRYAEPSKKSRSF